ncbi:MAG: protein translocase subunit SecD [Rhodospirillales bacterium]|nr:protein translocase subunit SecD [Rhodospirillales bacterium]MCB9995301.1 protein translocase subunit SecD [Rhodospirillales bacterium]
MLHIARWKIILIITVCVLGVFYSAPNMVGAQARSWLETLPGWLPTKTVNLGLDLQGGSHLLLGVDVDTVIRERSDDLVQTARPELRSAKIGYTRMVAIPGGMRLQVTQGADMDQVKKILRGLDNKLDVIVSEDGQTVEATYTDIALREMRDQIIGQSIEIIRRRVDETGTTEPIIQRQGDDRIIVQLPGVDDPERIKDILGQTAKLSFHLVDMGTSARDVRSGGGTRVLPMVDQPGQTIAIQRHALLTGEMLTNAQPAFDQGLPVVSFRLNGIGAKKFCTVTRDNVGKPFAIVLDDEVISAPRINGAICGGAAIITGQFSVQETNDLSLLLRAGALPAPLNILEERTVGPSLGADSVEAGKIASLVGMALIVVFMAASYGLFGVFADIALLVNVALILALLSALQATLTLPGIAGIVLTVGMAVDANVLIFERIREEVKQGRSAMSAIDSGYSRAMATIIDSNLTTLIAAIILFSFGTGPIKGFAVTLGIGIVTSFFSAIMVTRLMVLTWLKNKKPSELKV